MLPRSFSFRANLAFNLAGASLPLAASLITTPLYLARIGQGRYGVLALIWLLFGYFGLFDLGLSQATTNLMARTENRAPARQQEILWTASLMNALLGLIGGLAFLLAGDLVLERLIGIPTELRGEVRAAMPWVASLVSLSILSAVFAGTLESAQRFLELNAIQALGAVTVQVVPLLAVMHWGPRIEVAAAATAASRLATMLPICLLAVRQTGARTIPPFDRRIAVSLFRFGGWLTVSNIVGPILVSIDQFLIASTRGVASLPYYSIPSNLASRILMLPGAMTRALFPALSTLDPSAARRRTEAVMSTLSVALLAICGALILLAHQALQLWLGAPFAAQSSVIARTVLLGIWINGIAYLPAVYLQSAGRPRVIAALHVIELVPFCLMLYLALHWLGLLGAAIAWSLRVLTDAVLLVRVARLSHRAIAALAVPGALLLIAYAVSFRLQTSATASLTAALGLLVASVAYGASFDPELARLTRQLRPRWPSRSLP